MKLVLDRMVLPLAALACLLSAPSEPFPAPSLGARTPADDE